MSKAVCRLDSEACMNGTCANCPKEQGVKDFLWSLDSVGASDSFNYMQWVFVDRCNLVQV